MQNVQGPAWNLAGEYQSPTASAVDDDKAAVTALLDRIEALNPGLEADDRVVTARQIYKLSVEAHELLANLSTYAQCVLSVDSRDDAAQHLLGSLTNFEKRASELLEPLSQFTDLADDEEVDRYLDDPEVAPAAFLVLHARKRRDEILSLAEENLLSGLAQDGIHAWGNLYDQLSGTLRCEVPVGNEFATMGVAEAAGLTMVADDAQRESAFRAINAAWSEHEEACAGAINAIAGWRLEVCNKRSRVRPVHFLDGPAHMNRIEPATLDTLMDVAAKARPLAQRAASLQARAYGKERYGPWDQRAPAPVLDADGETKIAFAEATEIIAGAYAEVDPSMGEFVHMMVANEWVEGTVGPNKRPGAYCTRFAKSRTPRVYMTYQGGASDVITLAHELGHAYHGWVMRDLAQSQQSYGMSLAETASTFGETLVREAMLARAATPSARFDIVWEEVSAFISFILNIPTRFEFERNFYERRAERPLRPDELRELMSDAWRTWYGDSLAEPDPMFWANKLHFYISGLSFYNFPYLFGYLFSMGVYSQRQHHGETFFERYNALLRDTGRMTAEDLARTHLGADLTDDAFWMATIDAFGPRVDAFEKLLDELGR